MACAAVDILIAGGENNRGLHELRWLIEQDVYDVIQPEAMVAETMSSLRKIAALGELAAQAGHRVEASEDPSTLADAAPKVLQAICEGEPRFRSFTFDGQTIPLEDHLAIGRPTVRGSRPSFAPTG